MNNLFLFLMYDLKLPKLLVSLNLKEIDSRIPFTQNYDTEKSCINKHICL